MKQQAPAANSSELEPYCPICQKLRPSWADLKTHYKKGHCLSKIFPCKEKNCQGVFVSEWQLLGHQQLVHCYLKCTICALQFAHTLQLKTHMEQHFPERRNRPHKRSRPITVDDIKEVTSAYLRKLRKTLQLGNYEGKAGLFLSLQQCLSVDDCSITEDNDLDLLTFIIHASEVSATEWDSRGQGEAGSAEKSAEEETVSPPSPDIDFLAEDTLLETNPESVDTGQTVEFEEKSAATFQRIEEDPTGPLCDVIRPGKLLCPTCHDAFFSSSVLSRHERRVHNSVSQSVE